MQSSNLNEELGQISHIFSDKTGTLTSNIMMFRKFSAGMRTYGRELPSKDNNLFGQEQEQKIPNVEFFDPHYKLDFEKGAPNVDNIERMLLNLALNHSILVEKPAPSEEMTGLQTPVEVDDTANLKYNASSPDELALVNGARYLGATYIGRDSQNNNIALVNMRGQELKFELLNTIEFDSARKRMTSIFRNLATNRIVVMCKGADSALLPLLKDPED